jgi:hypothetical protein
MLGHMERSSVTVSDDENAGADMRQLDRDRKDA